MYSRHFFKAEAGTEAKLPRHKKPGFIDWVKVLHPTRHKIGHFGEVLPANLLA